MVLRPCESPRLAAVMFCGMPPGRLGCQLWFVSTACHALLLLLLALLLLLQLCLVLQECCPLLLLLLELLLLLLLLPRMLLLLPQLHSAIASHDRPGCRNKIGDWPVIYAK